jgi:3-carboxy-cis,cis-muconate cycloisomerase
MDTGMVLQVRRALQLVERDILEALISIRNLAVRFRDQPMAGRTHGQHAVPITFGLKAAIWGAELARSLDRLRLCHQRVLVGQLSGAAGTSAALGEAGTRVRELFCRRLGLGIPLTPWFSSRDGWAELVGSLSILAGSLEKISLEIVRLQSTEVAEVAEPARVGHVGSSTMPQKRNPFLSETTAALCRLVRGLAPVMTGCMVGAHERDMSTWAVEWLLIPQCMILMSGALAMFKEVISGLAVYPDRMRNNLGMTSGAIVSEAVMMELARSLGRDRAHELMMDATRVSRDKKEDLLAELSGRSEVRAVISPERLAALLEPANYLGDAATTVDEVIGVIAKQAGV